MRRRLNLQIAFVCFLLVLIGARVALPFVLVRYVNDRLDSLQGFEGSVGAIRVNLFKGAYTVFDLRLFKTGGEIPVPFLAAEKMELALEWREVLRGNLTGTVAFEAARLNFVMGPTEQEKQTGIDRRWSQTLDSLHPFTINRFDVRKGVIRYADPHRSPPVDIYLTNVTATATNLTNVQNKESELPARLFATAGTTGGGKLKIDLRIDPLAKAPEFKLAGSITALDLPALNDFLKSYVNADAESGRFWLFLNVAASGGRYQGIAKPFLINANTLGLSELDEQSILQSFWEGLVGAISEIFENQLTDRLATRVQIEGTFQSGTEIDLWAAIGGILRNAFLQALQPGVPRPVKLPGNESAASNPPQSPSPAEQNNQASE